MTALPTVAQMLARMRPAHRAVLRFYAAEMRPIVTGYGEAAATLQRWQAIDIGSDGIPILLARGEALRAALEATP